MEECKQDKDYLETRIKDIELKQKEEQELEQYNFTFEDIMLKRDLESIKCLINPLYQSSFEIKWNELSISEKQDLYDNFDLHEIANNTSKEQEINDYLYTKEYEYGNKDIGI